MHHNNVTFDLLQVLLLNCAVFTDSYTLWILQHNFFFNLLINAAMLLLTCFVLITYLRFSFPV